ncbi:unnamed protein product [Cuscuta campestris]|uniref:Uncharacterized protein n=1 Tax=Cuscuta campestris TaxID=132261 RepID=A0A484MW50_9ASTE|nr:unnamed protein product [Cuscuta campestris]
MFVEGKFRSPGGKPNLFVDMDLYTAQTPGYLRLFCPLDFTQPCCGKTKGLLIIGLLSRDSILRFGGEELLMVLLHSWTEIRTGNSFNTMTWEVYDGTSQVFG